MRRREDVWPWLPRPVRRRDQDRREGLAAR